MTTVALIGPGAIGTSVGAWLASVPGVELSVATRSPRDGLRVDSPSGPRAVFPEMWTEPGAARVVDWVLLAVKGYDVPSARAWLDRCVGDRTRVAVLQNGVEQTECVADVLPRERIVPVVVDIPAERRGDVVVQSAFGTLVVPDDEAGRAFVDLFSSTPIEATATSDFVTAAWRKLCVNAAGALCAATGQPNGISRQEPIAHAIRKVVAEAVAVGRAEGADLPDGLPDQVLARMQASPPMFVNSLLADRRAGRRTEVDIRNGAVVRGGIRHGIPTPLNELLCALIGVAPVGATPSDSPSERTT